MAVLCSFLFLTGLALGGATTHLYFTGLPVNLRIMLFQPGVPKNEGLTTQAGDRESGAFCVILKMQDDVDNLGDQAGFIPGPINIEHRNEMSELMHVEMIFLDISAVNELTDGTTVHKGRC